MSLHSSKFYLKHQLATAMAVFAPKHSGKNRALMYHSIFKKSAVVNDVFSVKLESFKKQIKMLKESYEVVPFESESSGISITFDDGFLDNLTLAAPVLLEANLPFTIFMISDFVKPEHKDYLNSNHLKELAANPLVTIGGHGKSHVPLASLSLTQAREELRISKEELENIIGKEVTTMSFPHGAFTPDILLAAQEIGYKKCGNSIPLPNSIPFTSGIQVNRQCIYECESLMSFKQKIDGQWDWIWKKGRIS